MTGLPFWLAVPLHLLSMFGCAYVLGHSHISLPFREMLSRVRTLHWLLTLIECPACLGFWFGFGDVLLRCSLLSDIPPTFKAAFIVGLTTCASNLLLARVAGLSERTHDP